MQNTSLAALDRTFRKLDRAFDGALTRGDSAEVSRMAALSQQAYAALYNAVPQTRQDVGIVLKRIGSALLASGDVAGVGLIPRLRGVRSVVDRGAVGLQTLVELRAIAAASEAVCDGAGPMPWLATWLRECADCLSRPRVV